MDFIEHRLPVRVYLEDTDAQGVVYHANYLKFFERARSECMESQGISVRDVAKADRRYVVYEIRVKFRSPASLGERLEVVSTMRRASAYRLSFQQELRRPEETAVLVSGDVDVVCIDERGRLVELPPLAFESCG